jgi:hypothetical protein
MRKAVLLVVAGLVFAVNIAGATQPEPTFCTATPLDTRLSVLTCPQYRGAAVTPLAGAAFTVNVRNGADEVIPNAVVEIVFNIPGNHVECGNIVSSGNTDANGNITFNLAAGGCSIGTNVIKIIANGVEIKHYNECVSPDGDHNGAVSLGDFTAFGSDFQSGAAGCYDFDNSGGTTLGDFTLFGQAFGLSCSPY